MGNYNVMDPWFFWGAIDMFEFPYVWFVKKKQEKDKPGRIVHGYEKKEIRGSLQSQGFTKNFNTSGNTTSHKYMFYCKAIYQIGIDDYIYYQGNLLHVDGVTVDYTYEYGIRACSLTVVQLIENRNLDDVEKFLEGGISLATSNNKIG